MENGARGIAALLGLGLLTASMFGLGYGASHWLVWVDLAVACVTLGSLGVITTYDMQGVATWPLAGLVLVASWMFSRAFSSTAWLGWLSLAIGCGFLILTVVFAVESRDRPRLHRGAV